MREGLAALVVVGMWGTANAFVRMSFPSAKCASRRAALQMAVQAGLAREYMQYRQLGDSELKVSHVCLGTMTWGNQNTAQDAFQQLSIAFDEYGVNFVDTAEMYPVPADSKYQGDTDRAISKWLPTRKREEIVLATKVSGFGSDRLRFLRKDNRSPRVTREDIIESVDASLERLGTDYIDLLQIHWPDRYIPIFGSDGYNVDARRQSVPIEESLRGLEEVIRSGKVRYVGISNESPYGIAQYEVGARKGLPKIISLQNAYSLLVRSDFDNGVLEACTNFCTDPASPVSPLPDGGLPLSVLAYSPLAGGVLSGKYIDFENAPANSRFKLFNGPLCRSAVKAYDAVAKKYGLSLTQLALGWCYTRKYVTSTIIGATTIDQLRENLESLKVKLNKEMLDDIHQVYLEYRDPARYISA